MVSYSSPLPTLIINMRLPTRCREISPQCLPCPRPLELVTLPQSHHLMDTDTAWNMLLLDLGISQGVREKDRVFESLNFLEKGLLK